MLGYQTIYDRSMNGVKTISDGSAVITNGIITAGHVNSTTSEFESIQINSDINGVDASFYDPTSSIQQQFDDITILMLDMTYDPDTNTTIFTDNVQIYGNLNGVDANFYDPTSSIQNQFNDITDRITAIDYDSGTDITNISSALQIAGDVVFGDSIRSSLPGDNIIVGDTFNSLGTGEFNSAFGVQSGYSVNTGSLNTSLGYSALAQNIDGNRNCACGTSSLQSLENGSYNTAIGDLAGTNYPISGTGNTFLGAGANADIDSNYSTAVGFGAIIDSDHQIMLGTASESVYCPNQLYVTDDSNLHNVLMTGIDDDNNAILEFKNYLGTSQALLYPSAFSNTMKFDNNMSNGVSFAYLGINTFIVDNSGNGTFTGGLNSTTATHSGLITANAGIYVPNSSSNGASFSVGNTTFPTGTVSDKGLLIYRNISGGDGEVDFVAGCGAGLGTSGVFNFYFANNSTAPTLIAKIDVSGKITAVGGIAGTTGTYSGLISGSSGLTISSGSSSLQGTTTTTLSSTTGSFSGLITGSNGITITSGNSSFKNTKINGVNSSSNGNIEFLDYLGSSQALIFPSALTNYFKLSTSMANGIGFDYAGLLTFSVDNSGNGVFANNVSAIDANLSGTLTAAKYAPNYTSSWFSVNYDTSYTITHSLAFTMTNPISVKIYYSNVSSPALGTDLIVEVTGQLSSYLLKHTDSNNIALRTRSFVATYYDGTTTQSVTSGYYKVYVY